MKGKITFYEILVFIAYGFFLLLGLAWLLVSMLSGGFFNIVAFVIVAVFGAQFYFRHRVANFVIGILTLFFSIWMLLDVVNTLNLMAKGAGGDGYSRGWLWFCLVSIIMSGILMFSYTKLSFKDQ